MSYLTNMNEEILDTLKKTIKCKEELRKHSNMNLHISQTLTRCFDYCFNANDEKLDIRKKLEIDSVIDFLHDELNTGHWKDVSSHTRQAFTSASYIKSLIWIKSSKVCTVELLKNCLKFLDMGLLLGAPLENNYDLLTISAKNLTKEINKLLKEKQRETLVFGKSESIKRKIDDEHREQFKKLQGNEIDSTDCPSLEFFYKTYFIKEIPVKLKRCMEHWPALEKWLDVQYLLDLAGDRTVPVEIGSHYVDENWSQKLMTLKEFITNYYLENNKNIAYLAQHNLFEQITELKDDIRIPEYCCLSLDYDNAKEPDINAWFGPKGTVSPLHYDPKSNLLAQVYGTKQLILFSPEDSPFLYPHEEKLLFNTSQVNPVQPNLEKFPKFSKTTLYKCLLEPGEMLYIPPKWWHHVTALDKSFSVSFWWQ